MNIINAENDIVYTVTKSNDNCINIGDSVRKIGNTIFIEREYLKFVYDTKYYEECEIEINLLKTNVIINNLEKRRRTILRAIGALK